MSPWTRLRVTQESPEESSEEMLPVSLTDSSCVSHPPCESPQGSPPPRAAPARCLRYFSAALTHAASSFSEAACWLMAAFTCRRNASRAAYPASPRARSSALRSVLYVSREASTAARRRWMSPFISATMRFVSSLLSRAPFSACASAARGGTGAPSA